MAKRKGARFEDKALRGPMAEDKELRELMALVRIQPLHAIGGYGRSGDVVRMPLWMARQYEKEGYVLILEAEDEPGERGGGAGEN